MSDDYASYEIVWLLGKYFVGKYSYNVSCGLQQSLYNGILAWTLKKGSIIIIELVKLNLQCS